MDGSARIVFTWGDGEHSFRLPLKQLQELQDKTGVGPHALYIRIAHKAWKVEDLRQTIRLGLIGGGMKAEEAFKLVARYVDDRPLLESVAPALAIIGAALSGADGDDAGKKATAEGSAETVTASPSPSLSEAPAQ